MEPRQPSVPVRDDSPWDILPRPGSASHRRGTQNLGRSPFCPSPCLSVREGLLLTSAPLSCLACLLYRTAQKCQPSFSLFPGFCRITRQKGHWDNAILPCGYENRPFESVPPGCPMAAALCAKKARDRSLSPFESRSNRTQAFLNTGPGWRRYLPRPSCRSGNRCPAGWH